MARDIASYGGVVIMLGMLREHAREEETVAATVHILYLITHADVMRGDVEIEVRCRRAAAAGRLVGETERGSDGKEGRQCGGCCSFVALQGPVNCRVVSAETQQQSLHC